MMNGCLSTWQLQVELENLYKLGIYTDAPHSGWGQGRCRGTTLVKIDCSFSVSGKVENTCLVGHACSPNLRGPSHTYTYLYSFSFKLTSQATHSYFLNVEIWKVGNSCPSPATLSQGLC